MNRRASLRTEIGRQIVSIHRSTGDEIRRLRLDAGISQARIAAAAGLDQAHISRIEAGTVEASIGALVTLGHVLGADLSVRFFPTTGPRIRDAIQAPMTEATLRVASRRWKRLIEVPVRRPARGAIDLVLADPEPAEIVAVELHSDLRRLEQQVRWGADKADSIRSSDAWPFLAASMDSREPQIHRLLILRSTARTRELARRYSSVL